MSVHHNDAYLPIRYLRTNSLHQRQDFRKRLRKYAHLASSMDRAKAFEARDHLHGICQAFARFLAEATDFYSDLHRRLEAMQHQYAKGGGGGGPDGAPVAGSSERRSRLGKLVVVSINRCLIFLGDLARYRELHGESPNKDWSVAEGHYQRVSRYFDEMPALHWPEMACIDLTMILVRSFFCDILSIFLFSLCM